MLNHRSYTSLNNLLIALVNLNNITPIINAWFIYINAKKYKLYQYHYNKYYCKYNQKFFYLTTH